MTELRNPLTGNNWKQIWEKKGNEEVAGDGLGQLIVYAGYNSATGKVGEDDFRQYVEDICAKVGISHADRVLEVGCGIGAFLHCIKPQPAEIVGVDYSQSIISRADKLKRKSNIRFHQAEADKIMSLKLGKFDVIFSNGVFFYFPSFEYAARVCRHMAESLNDYGRIAILDVNDAQKKDEFIALRHAEVGEQRYKELYKDLDQLFFEKSFFIEEFKALGYSNIVIEDQSWDGYKNSSYRFNVFVRP